MARRLGLSAETVHLIVRNQLADAEDKQIDPQRVIKDVGIDELSLKKRHRLYSTILTDLTNPYQPEVLAVAPGRDEPAARKCLGKLGKTQRQQVQTYRADMSRAYHKACRDLLRKAKPVVDRFHVAQLFNKAIDGQRKQLTQAYRAQLTAAERKEFRALLWEFRRDPQELSAAEKEKLAGLFRKVPQLRQLYAYRIRFRKPFDTAANRSNAYKALVELFLDMIEDFPKLDKFVCAYEHWQEEILNYFDARQTSAAVEGINHKARVILKRAYGLKSAESLWERLILDLNRARDIVMYTIADIHERVAGFRVSFACT